MLVGLPEWFRAGFRANTVYLRGGSIPTLLAVPFLFERGNEPMHVHAVKGDAECKYWLHADRFDIVEEFEYNCTPRLRREVRRIIF